MEQSPQGSKKKQVIAALAVLIVIVAIVAAAHITSKKKTTSTNVATATTSSAKPASTSTTAAPATSTASTYKDGSYTATGSYNSPGGNEQITISLTLKGDVITATSAKSGAGEAEGDQYQDMFISGYKKLVVGKKINTVSLSRVSGSSLTSQGFNDALKQIEAEAKNS